MGVPKLPRLWFKKEMKAAILDGRKVRTTRTHPLKVGVDYAAVSGSRFKAERFAVLHIVSRFPTTAHAIINGNFDQEGFESAQHMTEWLRKNKLLDVWVQTDELYTHRFEIKSKATATNSKSKPTSESTEAV